MSLHTSPSYTNPVADFAAYAARKGVLASSAVSVRPTHHTQFDIDQRTNVVTYRTQIEFANGSVSTRYIRNLLGSMTRYTGTSSVNVSRDIQYVPLTANGCTGIEIIHRAHRSNARKCGEIHSDEVEAIADTVVAGSHPFHFAA